MNSRRTQTGKTADKFLHPIAQAARLAKVIRIAGHRYTPKLNVSLPINAVFEGLGRTPAFFARIRESQGKVRRAYSRCRSQKAVGAAQAEYKSLEESVRPTRDEGVFVDARGEVVFLDPSVREEGPGVLLVNKEKLLAFLSKNDYDIVWTVLGEKGLIGGRIGSGYWPGRLEMSGAYRLDERHRITGAIHAKLVLPQAR